MTLDEFIYEHNGETLGYPTGSYVGECLSLVKVYIKEVFGILPPPSGSNSAYGYWSNFPSPLDTKFVKIANTPTGVPKPGDIVIWNTNVGNGYGHIAVFLFGDTNSFTSLDQNWQGRETHRQTHNYTNVVGWLHPKESSMPTDLEVCLTDREKFWKERDAALDRIKILEAERTDLQRQLDECRNKPTLPPTEPTAKWVVNGKTETYEENGKKITINYAVQS